MEHLCRVCLVPASHQLFRKETGSPSLLADRLDGHHADAPGHSLPSADQQNVASTDRLLQKLRYVTMLQIGAEAQPHEPQMLCDACVVQLNLAYAFKRRSVQASIHIQQNVIEMGAQSAELPLQRATDSPLRTAPSAGAALPTATRPDELPVVAPKNEPHSGDDCQQTPAYSDCMRQAGKWPAHVDTPRTGNGTQQALGESAMCQLPIDCNAALGQLNGSRQLIVAHPKVRRVRRSGELYRLQDSPTFWLHGDQVQRQSACMSRKPGQANSPDRKRHS